MHTPGPWRQGPEESLEIVQDKQGCYTGLKVAHVCHWAGMKREKAEANARLIAAAPDLLGALKEADEICNLARSYFPKSIKNSDTFHLLNVQANTIKKAIVKAEGRG